MYLGNNACERLISPDSPWADHSPATAAGVIPPFFPQARAINSMAITATSRQQEAECAAGPATAECITKPEAHTSRAERAMKETLRYAWGTSSLGEFIAAMSGDRKLVALEFAQRADGPASSLESRFPQAEFVEDPAGLRATLEKAARFIECPAATATLEVDMRGSDFEREVWSALQEIPAGRTISYSELACRVGGPHLAQEVGEACAANTIAVVIPCHRVLKKDGGISGYRWGVWRKRALLEREYRDNFSLT
jgi:AraC family transcriptional regulator of adaptative response/methylated-DNA-[protein]-cysteine methyltransferase